MCSSLFGCDHTNIARSSRVDDFNTVANPGQAPAGWDTPSGAGLHLVTDYEHDDLGRTTLELKPTHTADLAGTATAVRAATKAYYLDAEDSRATARGYATGSAGSYAYKTIDPVELVGLDFAGRVVATVEALAALPSGWPDPSQPLPQSAFSRLRLVAYDGSCQPVSETVYHDIPDSGPGQLGTNYQVSQFGYDSMGRRNRMVSQGGTITRTVYDARGLVLKRFVGTNDTGATESDPTGGGASGNNMTLVEELEYDGGAATGGGDGHLTKRTLKVDGNAANDRVTLFGYDYRGRNLWTDGALEFYEERVYDNMDRVTRVDRRNTSAAGNLIARQETLFDNAGRVYRTIRYAVDISTGTPGATLVDNLWYDAAGNVIKSQPAGAQTFTKTVFDSLGRQIRQYVGYDLNETFYSQVITVDGDTLFEQRETSYDAAGNVLVEVLRERDHDATGTGALNGPGGPEPKARTSYVARWADPLGRNLAAADYGTNGGTALTRPDTVPARSDTVLVTTTEYNGRGEPSKTIDPAGTETREESDDAGRLVKRVENYNAAPTGSDQSNTTEFTYAADGGYATITAKNATTGDQVTRYAYGTTLADSGVARSDLLRAEIYPDSDDVASPLGNGPDGVYDRFEMKYNRQGEVIERKDPAQTIHVLDYDKLGRPVHDRVTALGPQVNGAVRRVSRAYEVRGMLLEVTSWDNATVGSGAIVNQVRLAYNTFGQPVIEYQEHAGAVNTIASRKVQYGTAGGSGNSVRPTSITYPNGRVVVWDYSTSGSTPDALSRVARIFVDNVHVASYVYVGLGRIVQVDHPQPFIRYDLATGSGSDPYAGLDRFGRVIDCRWRDYGSGTPIDIERVQYGYDRASNRSYRENTVDTTTSKAELYGYDGMYRLKTFERGTLNAAKTALTTKTFAQQWNLDATGNWSGFNEDTNGDSTWELGQTRVSNKVNEIASFTNSPGPTWFAPTYDAAGNMTIAPVPSLPGPLNFRSQEFDAWNRLTKAVTSTEVLGEFSYDGLNRRIAKKTFTGGTPLNTRHYYYSLDWQVLEERLDAGTAADRQFVWGIRYIDDLLLRDRDTNADGTLDERLYGIQDDNWNLTALADPNGDMQERYRYDAYGLPTVLTPAFASRTASLFDWETLYASYRWDAETKLYQVRNRWLDSRVGVWVTRDQFDMLIVGLFEYADSRPLDTTDPFGNVVERQKIISAQHLNNLILQIENRYRDDSCIMLVCRLSRIFDPFTPCANRFVWLSKDKHYLDVGHFFAAACYNAGSSPSLVGSGIIFGLGYGVELIQTVQGSPSAQPFGGGDGEDLPSNWKGARFGPLFPIKDVCSPCRHHQVSVELVKLLLQWTGGDVLDRGPLYSK